MRFSLFHILVWGVAGSATPAILAYLVGINVVPWFIGGFAWGAVIGTVLTIGKDN